MKIIDAHHHYWDPVANYHPWLRDEPPIPFRYGDYSTIRSRFMPAEYDRVTANWDVAATVTMEGEWNPKDTVGEALWMQRLADDTGRPAAHAAQGWLDSPELECVLGIYDRLSIVRSVRHKPRANPAPGGAPGGMTDPAFREGFKRLADHGLMFELQTPWWHLEEAAEMAALAPGATIILNHAGLPADRSEPAMAGWRAAMKAFAEVPGTVVKISGIGLPGRPWTLEDNGPVIRHCIDCFGPERAMFASNFPVDGLCASFDTIFSGFDAATRDDPPEDRAALFHGTAARVYGLPPLD